MGFAFINCRLQDHIEDKDKLPILIFPEGWIFIHRMIVYMCNET